MILVDTSVVIDFLRTSDPKLSTLCIAHNAAVCGITRAEVLQGSRTAADRATLLAALNSFAQVATPDSLWDQVGDHGATLRRGGVTVPFADIVIATVAIANNLELWTHDGQFLHIQRMIPALQLFTEPP
jgi:predicted nucleic acid-binding protein